jgi:hypothetical protein
MYVITSNELNRVNTRSYTNMVTKSLLTGIWISLTSYVIYLMTLNHQYVCDSGSMQYVLVFGQFNLITVLFTAWFCSLVSLSTKEYHLEHVVLVNFITTYLCGSISFFMSTSENGYIQECIFPSYYIVLWWLLAITPYLFGVSLMIVFALFYVSGWFFYTCVNIKADSVNIIF